MKKRALFLFILLLIITGLYWYFQPQNTYGPGPLWGNRKATSSILTKEGVFAWTNTQRIQNSEESSLYLNEDLSKIAEMRVDDMFAKQYFEHVSPTGESASSVAEDTQYEYIAIGENIALGNFENDEVLVQAWMDSPGHRENILNHRYTEIGVAMKKGKYEEDEVWIAVQIFGRPLSDCSEPSTFSKNKIEENQILIEKLKKQAESQRVAIELLKHNASDYNTKVDEYNLVVKKVNDLVVEIKELIVQYNKQVKIFNECLLK